MQHYPLNSQRQHRPISRSQVAHFISSHLSTYILNAKWKTTPFLQTNDYGPALIIQLSCFIISACYVVPCHVRFGISNEWPKYPTTTTQKFEKNSPFNVSSRLHTLAPSSSTSPRPQETQSASHTKRDAIFEGAIHILLLLLLLLRMVRPLPSSFRLTVTCTVGRSEDDNDG